MMTLAPHLALAFISAASGPSAPLRVAARPLVGTADVGAIDEIVERELSEVSGLAVLPAEQVEHAFASCRGDPACFESASRALRADEVLLGMAGLDRGSWLVELTAVDPRGAVIRSVSARWRADASQLKTLADDLLNRLFAPEKNLALAELQPEGGSLAGLTLSLDGQEPTDARPGQPQLLTEGAHRLSIGGTSQEIELLFRAAPREHVQIWVNPLLGSARLVPSESAGGLTASPPPPVSAPATSSRARRIGGFASVGAAALLAGGAAWAGGSLSWDYSQLNALTGSGALLIDPTTDPRYTSYSSKAATNEGLAIGLGCASAVAAGLGIWLLAGG